MRINKGVYMVEPKQLNVHVTPREAKLVKDLQVAHGWTKRELIVTAVEALGDLMERHEKTAAKANEEDVGALFKRLARLMPAGLTDTKVEHGRFSDGRPALILAEQWVIAEDANGDLMVARKDGGEIGHINHGRIEILAVDDLALAEIAALN